MHSSFIASLKHRLVVIAAFLIVTLLALLDSVTAAASSPTVKWSEQDLASYHRTGVTVLSDVDAVRLKTSATSVILKWDVGSVPAGSTITAANITFASEPSENEERDDIITLFEAIGPSAHKAIVLGTARTDEAGGVMLNLNAAGLALLQEWLEHPKANRGFWLEGSDVPASTPTKLTVIYQK